MSRRARPAGTILPDFYCHPDKWLCAGALVTQRLRIKPGPSIESYIDRIVVPYLHAHAYYLRFGEIAFGELRKSAAG